MNSTLSFEQSRELQTKVGVFLERVLQESGKVLEITMPEYRVAFSQDGHYLMREAGTIMFWTVVMGDTGPSGTIERSTNWVGFSTISDRVLQQLDSETREVCLELLGESQ
jgi:hypothetical protein